MADELRKRIGTRACKMIGFTTRDIYRNVSAFTRAVAVIAFAVISSAYTIVEHIKDRSDREMHCIVTVVTIMLFIPGRIAKLLMFFYQKIYSQYQLNKEVKKRYTTIADCVIRLIMYVVLCVWTAHLYNRSSVFAEFQLAVVAFVFTMNQLLDEFEKPVDHCVVRKAIDLRRISTNYGSQGARGNRQDILGNYRVQQDAAIYWKGKFDAMKGRAQTFEDAFVQAQEENEYRNCDRILLGVAILLSLVAIVGMSYMLWNTEKSSSEAKIVTSDL